MIDETGWLTIYNGEDGHNHVVPNDDKHKESKNCWCCPVLDYQDSETKIQVWSHNDTRKNAVN